MFNMASEKLIQEIQSLITEECGEKYNLPVNSWWETQEWGRAYKNEIVKFEGLKEMEETVSYNELSDRLLEEIIEAINEKRKNREQ